MSCRIAAGALRLILIAACALLLSPAWAESDPPSYAAAFDRAFEPGFTVRQDGQTLPFHVLELGRLALPSGRLVGCDLLVNPEREPFAVRLPRGRFPLRLAVVSAKTWGERTAFARLDVGAGPVVRWVMALLPGQDPATLKPGYRFGYPSDAGTGSFLDAVTAEALVKDKAAYGGIVNAWIPERREGVLYPYKDANVGVFHSGFGDGVYTTWLGYDAAGEPAAVVTDFEVIDWENAR